MKSAPSDPKTSAPTNRGMKILLVEDEPQITELYIRLLRPSVGPHPLRSARNLKEAMTCIKEEAPEMVILDLGLPDSLGLEGLKAIRGACPSAAIVITTGLSDEAAALEAIRNGAEDYLFKGQLDGETLNRAVRYAYERKREAERARVSQELLASTLDALPAFVAILDPEGKVVALNRNWEAFSIPGNPLIQDCRIGTGYKQLCEGLDVEGVPLQRIAHGVLQVMNGETRTFHTDYDCPSGDSSLWFEVLSSRFDISGSAYAVVMHTDITDWMQIENRLKVSEGFSSIIANNMVDLLTIFDVKGQRTYASPSYSNLLGYTREEANQADFDDLVHPDDIEKSRAAFRELFASERPTHVEYRLRHKDGHYLFFDSIGTVLPASKGEEVKAIVVARNISGRKESELERARMEVQLRHAQKLESIGQLAAGIAHEINTPSQYIGDNLIFLDDAFRDLAHQVETQRSLILQLKNTQEPESPDADLAFLLQEVPKAISQCREGLARVTRIVGAMKDFSHPDSEAKIRTDLNRAIQSTVTVCRNEWKYVADMDLDLDPGLPAVPCLTGEFNQAILNLVINAAHAIADVQAQHKGGKGRITIRTRTAGDMAEILVEDTGAGIPEQIRPRIFDPFFTTKPVGKGTGQGLAIVYSVIVEKHGGSIDLESEVGRGTTFILRLPIQEA